MQAGSRRLTALLATDVAGYSRLTEVTETGTAGLLCKHRSVVEPLAAERGGRGRGSRNSALIGH